MRAALDSAFAARLAAAPETPAQQLAVETVLPELVARLAKGNRVLLVVVDGMSGAVAGDVADHLTDHLRGWNEVVRAANGAREAVLRRPHRAQPSHPGQPVLRRLAPRDRGGEKPAFAGHGFWPSGGAVLVHKSGMQGSDGNDLGAELEQAVGPDGPPVVGVVLNAVDDSLKAGRQSVDPGWRPRTYRPLAAARSRGVLGPHRGAHQRPRAHPRTRLPAADRHQRRARWRAAGLPVRPDEVLVAGPRVLTPEGRAILAATEELRYGREAHGYHGGASLAEVAIPLVSAAATGDRFTAGWDASRAGWSELVGGETPQRAPVAQRVPPAPAVGSRKKPERPVGGTVRRSRGGAGRRGPRAGARLVTSEAFRSVHAERPGQQCPGPGGRSPLSSMLSVRGGWAVAGGVGDGGRGKRWTQLARSGRRTRAGAQPRQLPRDHDGRRRPAVALDRALLDEQFPPP